MFRNNLCYAIGPCIGPSTQLCNATSRQNSATPFPHFVMVNYFNKPVPAEKPPVTAVERRWGSFKQSAHNCECTVSLLIVQRGQRLRLQSHTPRAGLSIAIRDGARLQL